MAEVKDIKFSELLNDYDKLESEFESLKKINSLDDVDISDYETSVIIQKEQFEGVLKEVECFNKKWIEGFLNSITLRQKNDKYEKIIKDVNKMKISLEESISYIETKLELLKL